jgi:bifunctional non-homologous end joining protein LigD
MRPRTSGFVEPCLPSTAPKPPSGPNWIHEIKHDGFRMMVRRDDGRIRLLTRNGHDWTGRFPLIAEAATAAVALRAGVDTGKVLSDRRGSDRLRARWPRLVRAAARSPV